MADGVGGGEVEGTVAEAAGSLVGEVCAVTSATLVAGGEVFDGSGLSGGSPLEHAAPKIEKITNHKIPARWIIRIPPFLTQFASLANVQ